MQEKSNVSIGVHLSLGILIQTDYVQEFSDC